MIKEIPQMSPNIEERFTDEREYNWELEELRRRVNKLNEFANKLTLMHFGVEFKEIGSSSNLEKPRNSEEEKMRDVKREYEKKMEELDNEYKKIKKRKPLHMPQIKEWEEKESQFQETLEVIRGI